MSQSVPRNDRRRRVRPIFWNISDSRSMTTFLFFALLQKTAYFQEHSLHFVVVPPSCHSSSFNRPFYYMSYFTHFLRPNWKWIDSQGIRQAISLSIYINTKREKKTRGCWNIMHCICCDLKGFSPPSLLDKATDELSPKQKENLNRKKNHFVPSNSPENILGSCGWYFLGKDRVPSLFLTVIFTIATTFTAEYLHLKSMSSKQETKVLERREVRIDTSISAATVLTCNFKYSLYAPSCDYSLCVQDPTVKCV